MKPNQIMEKTTKSKKKQKKTNRTCHVPHLILKKKIM